MGSPTGSFHSKKLQKTLIFGPVAQLGERSVRIREVESSNLFRSTKARSQDLSPAVWFLFMQGNDKNSRSQLPEKECGRLFWFLAIAVSLNCSMVFGIADNTFGAAFKFL